MRSSFHPNSKFAGLSVERRREELIRRLQDCCSELRLKLLDIDLDTLSSNLAEGARRMREYAELDGDPATLTADASTLYSLCMIAESFRTALREAARLQSANSAKSQPVSTPEKSANP